MEYQISIYKAGEILTANLNPVYKKIGSIEKIMEHAAADGIEAAQRFLDEAPTGSKRHNRMRNIKNSTWWNEYYEKFPTREEIIPTPAGTVTVVIDGRRKNDREYIETIETAVLFWLEMGFDKAVPFYQERDGTRVEIPIKNIDVIK